MEKEQEKWRSEQKVYREAKKENENSKGRLVLWLCWIASDNNKQKKQLHQQLYTNTCNCDNLLERACSVFSLFWLQSPFLFSGSFLHSFSSSSSSSFSTSFCVCRLGVRFSIVCFSPPRRSIHRRLVWWLLLSEVPLHLINYHTLHATHTHTYSWPEKLMSHVAFRFYCATVAISMCMYGVCVREGVRACVCVWMNIIVCFRFIVIYHAICWLWKWNDRFARFCFIFHFPFVFIRIVRALIRLTTLCVCLLFCVILKSLSFALPRCVGDSRTVPFLSTYCVNCWLVFIDKCGGVRRIQNTRWRRKTKRRQKLNQRISKRHGLMWHAITFSIHTISSIKYLMESMAFFLLLLLFCLLSPSQFAPLPPPRMACAFVAAKLKSAYRKVR